MGKSSDPDLGLKYKTPVLKDKSRQVDWRLLVRGAPGASRTRDTRLRRSVLYPLSYGGVSVDIYNNTANWVLKVKLGGTHFLHNGYPGSVFPYPYGGRYLQREKGLKMTWEIKVFDEFEHEVIDKIAEEVADCLEENGVDRYDEDAIEEGISEVIHDCIDGWFIYNVDQLAALQYYGHISDGFDACWEDIYSDVSEKAKKLYWK